MFFVLDGDCREKYKKSKLPSRTIILPGEYRPESILYDFLLNLSDEDDFWNEDENFIKQTCFANYQTKNNDKWVIKRWFKNPKFTKYFGRSYSKLFNRWKKDNKDSVKEFQDNFKNMINK